MTARTRRWAASISAFVCLLAIAGIQSAQAQVKDFNVPAQSATTGIPEFARQAGIQILVSEKLVRGKQTGIVTGSHSVEEALVILLKGTGLVATSKDGATYTVAVFSASPRDPSSTNQGAISSQDFRVAQVDQTSAGPQIASDKTPKKDEALTEIVVTGSLIPRQPEDSVASVTTIDREELERLGVNTIGDLLRYIPGNQGSSQTSSISTIGANHFANLRGLGPGSTLVLIDGRRPATSATSLYTPGNASQFNLDVLPEAAVERVEILKDSASALYGSDAIGGVINIVLRNDFKGVEVSTRYAEVTSGHAPQLTMSIVGGDRIGPLSFVGGVEYSYQGELQGGSRDYSASLNKAPFGGSDFSNPFLTAPLRANVSSIDGSNLPGLNSPIAAVPNVKPRPLTIGDFAATAGMSNPTIDYTSYVDLIQPQNRTSAFAHAEYEFSPSVSAHLDYLESQSRVLYAFQFPYVQSVLGAGNPYNPFGRDVLASFYILNAPGFDAASKATDRNASFGVSGSIGDSWKWDATATYGKSDLDEHEFGVSYSNLAAALISTDPKTALNPFFSGDGNSPAVLNSLVATTLTNRTTTDLYGMTLTANGSLFDLPSGPVRAAAGMDYRHEAYAQVANSVSVLTPITVDTSRQVEAAYSEVSVPLLPSEGHRTPLELVGALRYEHYSDFGGTLNGKAGLVWRPLERFYLRGSYSNAFQAPNLSQLNAAPAVQSGALFGTIFDPKTQQSYVVSGNVITGGNSKLQPQTADSAQIGTGVSADVHGIGFAADLDFYDIKFSKQIETSLPIQQYINLENDFPSLIVRDPVTGRIVDVYRSPINVARVHTNGADVTLSATVPFPVGLLRIASSSTFVSKFSQQASPDAESVNRRSYIGFANPFKTNMQLTYSFGGFSAVSVINYAGRYGSDAPPQVFIRANGTVDLMVSYAFRIPGLSHDVGSQNARIDIGAINIADRAPPFYNNSYGFDIGEGDPLGRRVYIRLKATF